ncbi:hypothetical protein V1509DRAFT_640934 [Lipomyces kononenkoae]
MATQVYICVIRLVESCYENGGPPAAEFRGTHIRRVPPPNQSEIPSRLAGEYTPRSTWNQMIEMKRAATVTGHIVARNARWPTTSATVATATNRITEIVDEHRANFRKGKFMITFEISAVKNNVARRSTVLTTTATRWEVRGEITCAISMVLV